MTRMCRIQRDRWLCRAWGSFDGKRKLHTVIAYGRNYSAWLRQYNPLASEWLAFQSFVIEATYLLCSLSYEDEALPVVGISGVIWLVISAL